MRATRLKTRHFIASVAVILLLAVLTQLLFSTYRTYTDTTIRQQQQRLLTVARSVATNLELYLYEQLRDVEILVRTPGFISEMREYYSGGEVGGAKEYVLSYMLAHYMGLSRVYLLDRDGTELFRYSQYPFLDEFDESVLELERLSAIRNNEVGGVFEIAPGQYGLTLVNIIYAGDEYLGCVVGLIGIDTLYSQLVSPLGFQESEYLMVKDGAGTVIMHPRREMIGRNVFSDFGNRLAEPPSPSLAAMLERQYAREEGVSIYRSHTGGLLTEREEINAYTRINVTGATWMVSAGMPLSEAIRPVNDNLGRFTLLTVIIFLIIAAAAAVIYTLQKKRQRLAMQAGYLQDINNTLEELHQSREQVRHYQKLQTIGALAGGIVHEFNNLLTPIMGYCEFLLERMGPDSEYADDLAEIHKAGARAKEIIEQILPFSRRESDRSVYSAVSVDAILRDAVKTVRLILPSSIYLELSLPVSGINVFGSASQLNQVLLNLCTNAYQAMEPDGGVMRVGCKLLPARQLPEQYRSAEASGEYAELWVSDTGCGMRPEVAEKVFEAFYTTKKAGEGTGLGLSVVRSIVHNHNGFLALDTAPGKGSRFSVYLPTTAAPVLPKTASPAPAEAARGLTVLLIDDDPRIVRYLGKRLRKSGYTVAAHTSPESGLAAFRETPDVWDLVILDYTMPVYKGTELARRFKKERPELKVCLVTGLVEKDALQMKQEGILDEILIKPLDYQELLAAARRL